MTANQSTEFDTFLTAIIANRIDGIVREMTYTLQRAARAAVLASARDFSCSICTGDNELLAAAEGLPIHIFGNSLQTRKMSEFHFNDIKEGDCYLHNDPYSGNTHPGDHTYLVPVFIEGEHLFTTVVKAHQADIGNSTPTTLFAGAKDVYEEGALIFPAVRVQRDYKMQDDIVRMCRSRIRAPAQWYGDFLAGIGSARVGERRLKDLCEKYGKETVKSFIKNWLDYSEHRMIQELKKLPKSSLKTSNAHDPFGSMLPDGIPVNVEIDIRPEDAMIDIDLTNNIDNVDCGFNSTEACVTAASLAGVFNSIDSTVPRNSGSFRRVNVTMRDGSVVGRPKFPHSCSLATTNVADRLLNLVQATFAQVGDGYGVAEGGVGIGAGFGVISGKDESAEDGCFVNMLIIASASGPAGPRADGWLTYGQPVVSGMMYRDSVEVDELKYPIKFDYLRIIPGTGGAGRYRGAPSVELAYGPTNDAMDVIWVCDGTHFPSKGVRGGHDGVCARHFKVDGQGQELELPNMAHVRLEVGELVKGRHATGGGYGNPMEREPNRVHTDIVERFETLERARDLYGVAFQGSPDDGSLTIDWSETEKLRSQAA